MQRISFRIDTEIYLETKRTNWLMADGHDGQLTWSTKKLKKYVNYIKLLKTNKNHDKLCKSGAKLNIRDKRMWFLFWINGHRSWRFHILTGTLTGQWKRYTSAAAVTTRYFRIGVVCNGIGLSMLPNSNVGYYILLSTYFVCIRFFRFHLYLQHYENIHLLCFIM